MEYSTQEIAEMLIPKIEPGDVKSMNRYGGMDKLKRIFDFENAMLSMGNALSTVFDQSLRESMYAFLVFRNRIDSGSIIPPENSGEDDPYVRFLEGFILKKFLGKKRDISEFDFFNADEVKQIYLASSRALSIVRSGIDFSNPQVDDKFNPNTGEGYVYVMCNRRNGYHKIGMTRKEPKFREKTLQSEEPEIELVFSLKCADPDKLEAYLHEIFADKRVRGEWFDLDESDLQEIFEMSE